jgi:hypothetical protein
MTELYGITHDGMFLIKDEIDPPRWSFPPAGKHWPPYTAKSIEEATIYMKVIKKYFRKKKIPVDGIKIYIFTEEDTLKLLRGY